MVRLLSDTDIKRLVTMNDIVPAVEQVFAEYADGRVEMPGKTYVNVRGYGDFRAMPAYVPSINTAGIKWVNVHPDNPQKGLPTVMATLLLNEPKTGRLLCVMNASSLTDERTGAAGGVAAKDLARRGASTVGIIGSGHQAYTQILAYNVVLGPQIRLVRVYSRHAEHAEALARRIHGEMGYEAMAVESAREAADDADIIATATPARSPVLKAEWVRPGAHVNAIGADAPGKQELESALTLKARVFVDSVEPASHSGEVNVPISQGLMDKNKIAGTIGQVITGNVPGRTSDEDITIFDSTGLSIQDMTVGRIVYQRALKDGLGTDINI
jgi:alanine dehydrogenase